MLDAVGPDILAFDDLVRLIATSMGAKTRIVHVSPLRSLPFKCFAS